MIAILVDQVGFTKMTSYSLFLYLLKGLTRLGFGLNVAAKIMPQILKTVRGKEEEVENTTFTWTS